MKRIIYILFAFTLYNSISGKVLQVVIEKRELILNGILWSNAGPYELIQGKVVFGFDPNNQYNKQITDIALATVNDEGLVIASSDLIVLRPVNLPVSPVALVEVSNRGRKFIPGLFLNGSGGQVSPSDPALYGDGLLLHYGMTIIWVGWQFDLPNDEDLLNFLAPIARNEDGSSIVGRVRSDWTVDEKSHNLKLGHRTQTGYPALGTHSRALLTRRTTREGPREPVSMKAWRFGRIENGEYIPDNHYICSEEGFAEGYIYELIYSSSDPPLVGLGLAAVRDIISYVKYDPNCLFRADKGIAAGVSQTGRFLRHFIYQGFNRDEDGKKAYDGMMIMMAGAGRGSFNHRFAQPSRDAHPYSAFFYPTDLFPFTGTLQTDPANGLEDGLFSSLDTAFLPRIFYVNTGYEYWGRAASLIHTSVDGKRDILPKSNERIFHIASAQHYVVGIPDAISYQDDPPASNFLDFRANFRALLMSLTDWVVHDRNPSESKYPTIQSGNLVPPENVAYPKSLDIMQIPEPHKAYRVNYGPLWASGIIEFQPPIVGHSFPSLVPQVDAVGNEKSGIRNIEVSVPLGTYIPWSKRKEFAGSPEAIRDFVGHFIPLPVHPDEDDITPSIVQLYEGKTGFLSVVKDSITRLIQDKFLLPEDGSLVLERNSIYWNLLRKPESDSRRQKIHLVSYNIRYNNPNDGPNAWPLRKEKLIAQLKSFDADIIGIQEALQDQCRDLRRGLKGYVLLGVGREDGGKKGEFAPVLYNRKIWKERNSGHFWLSETPDIPSKGWDAALNRIVTWVELQHKRSLNRLFVFNTHFDHLGEVARLQSIYLLQRKIEEIAGDNPAVVSGDFNFTPSSDAYYEFNLNPDFKRYKDARHYSSVTPEGPVGTYKGFEVGSMQPETRIDYIFGNEHIHFLSYRVDSQVSGNAYLSDHLPVIAGFYLASD